ncbi:type II secretion system F family protein [Telmatospirillum siberiense]|uniref:Type II secretion system protein GspF domain-containing protein n=1 Tax=Telmatospirillum siberiense TaxID=382514 RepID=A0A2N3PLW9_9PROT|nr:type II secretion system F family protein [Telmatospirillum siberiense]PKU21394.1 hypothetical protein CWS72_26985 [Telmatospirillum siberiense]
MHQPLTIRLPAARLLSTILAPVRTLFGDETAALKRRIKRDHRWRLNFYRTLAARYRTNQSFLHTVRRLAERGGNRHPRAPTTRILSSWALRLEQEGELLHEVLAGWVPPDEQLIVAASQDDTGVDRAAWLVEKKLNLSSTARTALLYPALLVCGLFAMLFIIGTKVLPIIISIQTAEGKAPPLLLAAVATQAWLFPFPLIAAYLAIRLSLPRWIGDRRVWLDLHMWPWTQWRRRQGVTFLLAYSAMWGSGMTDVVALNAIAKGAAPWLRQRVQAIAYWVGEGRPLGEAMDQAGFGFPDPDTIEDIGDLDTTPDQMADHLGLLAEETSKAIEEEMRTITMILGLGTMGATALAVAMIGLSMAGMFDFSASMGMAGGR